MFNVTFISMKVEQKLLSNPFWTYRGGSIVVRTVSLQLRDVGLIVSSRKIKMPNE